MCPNSGGTKDIHGNLGKYNLQITGAVERSSYMPPWPVVPLAGLKDLSGKS